MYISLPDNVHTNSAMSAVDHCYKS